MEPWLDQHVVLGILAIFICANIHSVSRLISQHWIVNIVSISIELIKNISCSFSVSEIRLDPHLAVDTSSGSQYGSRGALAWTPPTSNEGSTPTWTEGTPSFTESSSSDMGKLWQFVLFWIYHWISTRMKTWPPSMQKKTERTKW